MTTSGRDDDRLREAVRVVLNGKCDSGAEQFADCDYCVSAVLIAESVERISARCEALETALREALRRWRARETSSFALLQMDDTEEHKRHLFMGYVQALKECAFDVDDLLSAEPPAPKEGQ